jgi:hypothetical protein
MQRSSSKCESNNRPGDRPKSSSEADWMKKKTEKKRDGVTLTRETRQNARRNTTKCDRKQREERGFVGSRKNAQEAMT